MYQNLHESRVIIQIEMSSNTHCKSCQLKLYMNYYVNCHARFGASFNIQFSVPSIIILVNSIVY